MSPMFTVFVAIRRVIDARQAAGVCETSRSEVVDALLADPNVYELAVEQSTGNPTYDTPGRWLGNQYDWFTGWWWGRTEWHLGLSKRHDGTWTVLSASPGDAEVIGSVAAVVDWYADATGQDPSAARALVDAAALHRIAPGLWELFVDCTEDRDLAAMTNAAFVGWASHFLMHSTDTWATHGQRR